MRSFFGVGNKKNDLIGKEQIFDLSNLERDRWLHA